MLHKKNEKYGNTDTNLNVYNSINMKNELWTSQWWTEKVSGKEQNEKKKSLIKRSWEFHTTLKTIKSCRGSFFGKCSIQGGQNVKTEDTRQIFQCIPDYVLTITLLACEFKIHYCWNVVCHWPCPWSLVHPQRGSRQRAW